MTHDHPDRATPLRELRIAGAASPGERHLLLAVLVASASCAGGSTEPRRLVIEPEACAADAITGVAEPWGEAREVSVDDDVRLVLRDCLSEGESHVRFIYEGPSPRPGVHLVRYSLYEGSGWVLADTRTGRWHDIGSGSEPPLFSPNGRFLTLSGADLFAGYEPSGIRVLGFSEDSLVTLLELSGGGEWGAVGPRWEGDDTLAFWKVRLRNGPSAGAELDSVFRRVIREDGAWREATR